jgi:predicted ATPase
VQASLLLSTEHGFPYLRLISMVRQGWELARAKRVEEGIAQMRQSLAALQATGSQLLRPYHLALLAEACGIGGQIETGLRALDEGLMAADDHAERFYEAELHRLKGELLLRKIMETRGTSASAGTPQEHSSNAETSDRLSLEVEAEACFQSALAIARRQGARALELRAALNLSRLWRQQGKPADAKQLLSAIYAWFTEGFDAADLQEASALLQELA